MCRGRRITRSTSSEISSVIAAVTSTRAAPFGSSPRMPSSSPRPPAAIRSSAHAMMIVLTSSSLSTALRMSWPSCAAVPLTPIGARPRMRRVARPVAVAGMNAGPSLPRRRRAASATATAPSTSLVTTNTAGPPCAPAAPVRCARSSAGERKRRISAQSWGSVYTVFWLRETPAAAPLCGSLPAAGVVVSSWSTTSSLVVKRRRGATRDRVAQGAPGR